jgi:hypothetical protein
MACVRGSALVDLRRIDAGRAPTLEHEDRALKLDALINRLDAFARAQISLAVIQRELRPVLAADPLDITVSDDAPWAASPAEERLFWRLVYLIETSNDDAPFAPVLAGRLIECLARTASPQITHELMPVMMDQDRLCEIVGRHQREIISRTGFLSVVTESGYPAHIKLWLQHASTDALGELCERLATGRYDLVAAGFNAPPAR